MTNEYTVTQYAKREQVTRETVRNWIRKGALETRKTPGGQFRIIEASTDGNDTRAATSTHAGPRK